jgi:hypothetical protein
MDLAMAAPSILVAVIAVLENRREDAVGDNRAGEMRVRNICLGGVPVARSGNRRPTLILMAEPGSEGRKVSNGTKASFHRSFFGLLTVSIDLFATMSQGIVWAKFQWNNDSPRAGTLQKRSDAKRTHQLRFCSRDTII